MNGTQFIKDHGLERAREVVAQALEGHNKFDVSKDQTVEIYKIRNHLVDLRHLQRLVESVDLITKVGGLEAANRKLKMALFNEFLLISFPVESGIGSIYTHKVELAIKDYESIYGEGNE